MCVYIYIYILTGMSLVKVPQLEFFPENMEGPAVARSFNGGLSLSFSSYLKPEEPVIIGVSGYGVKHGRLSRVDDSAEISIFDAKRYFNEERNSHLQKRAVVDDKDSSVMNVNVSNLEQIPEPCGGAGMQRFSSASSSVDGYSYSRNYRARSFRSATPTASSEASWNSQTGLLSNPPGAISVSVLPRSDDRHEKTTRSSPSPVRWIFRSPKCPCSGKKSVQVEESKPSLEKNTPPGQMAAAAGVSFERSSVKKPSMSATECKMATLEKQQWSGQGRFADHLTEQISLPPPAAHNRFLATVENRFSANMLMKEQNQFVLNSSRTFGDQNSNIVTVNNTAGFTFPILNKGTGTPPSDSPALTLRLNGCSVPVLNPSLEDPPRNLLGVFRQSEEATIARKNNINNNRECPVGFIKFLGSPKSRIIPGANGDDDVASDASSDLFEIESFSTQTTSTYPVMLHQRDSLEEIRRLGGGRSVDEPMTPSSIAPTDWYEPSEASIDWSVTTAEGFDRASTAHFSIAASEANDVLTMARRAEQEKSGIGGTGRRVSSSGNGLLGCRNEKALSVGPHPVKFISSDSAFNGGGEKHSAAAAVKHVNSRRPPLPVARSQSGRLSQGFGA